MTEIDAMVKVDHKGNLWLFVPRWATRTKIIPSYWNRYVEDFANCPRCGEPMKPIYPMGDKEVGLDFFVCQKCAVAYTKTGNPLKPLKPMAKTVDLRT